MIQAQVYVTKDREKAEGGTGLGLLVGIDPQRPPIAADGRDLPEVQERYLRVLSGYCNEEEGNRSELNPPEEYLKNFPELSLSELEKAALEGGGKQIKLKEAGEILISQKNEIYLWYLKDALNKRGEDLRVRFYEEVN